MKQLVLFDTKSEKDNWITKSFSANNLCTDTNRQALENLYSNILEITEKFNRKSVSYQLSKKEHIHRWLKYKEGFSSDLVETLLEEMNICQNDTVVDPFLGSGTTSLVCLLNGINSIGFDIMPMSKIATLAKTNIFKYDIKEIIKFKEYINKNPRPKNYNLRTNSINITKGAYPIDTEYDIEYYCELIKQSNFSEDSKNLFILCLLNSLEKISYTAKDGQYLRWDYRSEKVLNSNKKRKEKGLPPIKVILNKGILPKVIDVLNSEINIYINDIMVIRNSFDKQKCNVNTKIFMNSALFGLQNIESNSINGVITSPPYCNRYDYTRIYALELAFMGISDDSIKQMRQELLSCTVESKNKLSRIKKFYHAINRDDDYIKIENIINNNFVLNEIIEALNKRKLNDDINNSGVIRMVRGYFEELTIIFYELFRICKHGAMVAFVNDNVRYAGEIIPIDFMSTQIAEMIGFKPKRIYSLKQQKGNSSQQMKKFGRVPLRKSITIWEKE
ncbi:modification methylase [bacterium]|nr:modification methylase [bacterium]